jgi:hypothetical protein
MANTYSTSDLLRGALKKAGENTDGTSPYHLRALELMNKVYLDALSGASMFDVDIGDPFPWAKSREQKSITLLPPYETGTVTLTKGSKVGSFSDAPDALLGSFRDRLLSVSGRVDYYSIASHTAGQTAFELSHEWAEEDVTDHAFSAFKLVYNVADKEPSEILRLCAPFRVYRRSGVLDDNDGRVFSLSEEAMDDHYPLSRLTSGVPDRFSVVYESEETGEHLVRFSHFVLEPMKVDIPFVPMPEDLIDSDSSIPVLPRERRIFLEFATAYHLLDEKNDTKANDYYHLAGRQLAALMKSERKEVRQASKNRGQLIARRDQNSRKHIWR